VFEINSYLYLFMFLLTAAFCECSCDEETKACLAEAFCGRYRWHSPRAEVQQIIRACSSLLHTLFHLWGLAIQESMLCLAMLDCSFLKCLDSSKGAILQSLVSSMGILSLLLPPNISVEGHLVECLGTCVRALAYPKRGYICGMSTV
jgi:hypothetical protein